MFSLFNRNKANITAISIPDFGWAKIRNEKSVIAWVNPEQTVAVSINYFDMPPDIPTIKNVDTLRQFYRHSVSQANGGLVEVDLRQKDDIPFVKNIFKFPQEERGMTYIGSLTIPFKFCSFVLKVQAVEAGMTGKRDALIANKLMLEGMVSLEDDGLSNWFADPYDSNFLGGTLMNKAEDSMYDSQFPDHPLTKVRQLLKQIEDGLQWTIKIDKLPSFDK